MDVRMALSLAIDAANEIDADSVRETFQGKEVEVKSPQNGMYNCIAWAIGDKCNVWSDGENDYWPPNCVKGSTVKLLVATYGEFGFLECGLDDSLEENVDRIAIFADGETWMHACKQTTDGKWWSKLGQWEDVIHELKDAELVEGYGELSVILKRVRQGVSSA